jgi:hypothetical protein
MGEKCQRCIFRTVHTILRDGVFCYLARPKQMDSTYTVERSIAVFPSLILLVALSRVLPHPANFAPIAALGLFAGAYSNRRSSWLIPLAALLAGDFLIGFYNPLVMLFVYAGFAVSGLLGRSFLQNRRSALRIGACSLASAMAFFTLSNLGCWLAGMYPHTLAGLGQCYFMAIPFLRNTVLGDIFYTAALFGLYELAQKWAARRQADAVTG